MQPNRLHCPHCSVVLRIRDRKHVGRQVDCPDCGQAIQVLADGPHKLQLAKVAVQTASVVSDGAVTTATIATPTTASGQPPLPPSQLQKYLASLTSATGIAWSVAIASGLVLLFIAAPFQSNEATPAPVTPDTKQKRPLVVAPRDAQVKTKTPAASPQLAVGLQPKLENLGGRLMEFVAEHGRFPTSATAAVGMTEEQRLSWIAEFIADMEPDSQPLWDQTWRDPLNDRFVRRTLAEFQNPNVKQPTGPDRYPATHFVGIAGVGVDAPRLPVSHRRAGIFGIGRRTRIADIKDGQANTMMVVGVTKDIGRWAGSGMSTLRPLTAEPYIDGPDGFGTGEEQGMSVLMADGSVRFLAKKTDPRLIRRMAAMADGFPLDVKVPGEPGDQPPPTERKQPQNPIAQANPEQPVEPAPAENTVVDGPPVIAPVPPKVIDVAALLTQPILKYEQTKAAPLRVVLLEVEEMIGVPIRYDEKQLGGDAGQLTKSIQLKKLEDTTVGAILTALLEQAGLSFEIEKNTIRLKQQ